MTTTHTHRAIAPPRSSPPPARRQISPAAIWVAAICTLQAVLANRPGQNSNAFEDEGLYVYIGHRMIDHILHGTLVTEYPGKFFSGAPGLYPVLAAAADSVGGLPAARNVSLGFALIATVAVFGLTRELFGATAGVIAAAAFSVCGPVLFQSHFATFDAMAMAFVATAVWLAVRSTRRDQLLWAPAVAVLLALAFLTKYGTGVYTPIVAALTVAVGWQGARWKIALRALFLMIATVVISFFIVAYWGSDLVDGLSTTTSNRIVLVPESTTELLQQIGLWVGPWLILAAGGAILRARHDWRIPLVLLGGAVVAPLEQLRIGEGESLAKHLAFGMVFAAPLAGHILAQLLSTPRLVPVVPATAARAVGAVALGAVLTVLTATGLHYSHAFGTSWVDDRDLIPALQRDIALTPGKTILGEQPAPQHYALRATTTPTQWTDTYSFHYANLEGQPAYVDAIQQSHFGVIYLNLNTPNGRFLHNYLTTVVTPYALDSKPNRYFEGRIVGQWLVYLPKVVGGPPG